MNILPISELEGKLISPVVSTNSGAVKILGSTQVGYAEIDGIQHASVWKSSAASWFDLNPSGFSDCYAWDISSDGFNDYIVGQGFNIANKRYEALLWTQPSTVPEPSCFAGLGLGVTAFVRRKLRERKK